MPTHVPRPLSMMQLAAAFAIAWTPTWSYSAVPISEALMERDFTSIQLGEIKSSTVATGPHSRFAQPAAVGPVEKIDFVANRISVAGQMVEMTGLNIDDYNLGDFVSVSGLVSTSGITEASIHPLAIPYVYGATLSYIEGFVATSDASSGIATIGGSTVDFNMALSKSLSSATEVTENSYIRVVGIQVSSGSIVGADMQVVPLNDPRGNLKNQPAAIATKAILGGDRSAKAIIGSDRSTKVILGGDRSPKAIIGGDRSTKVILGGDRSAKAIIGGDRSTKVILGGDRSPKAIIGGDRSAKIILGGDRSPKAGIGSNRSTN